MSALEMDEIDGLGLNMQNLINNVSLFTFACVRLFLWFGGFFLLIDLSLKAEREKNRQESWGLQTVQSNRIV